MMKNASPSGGYEKIRTIICAAVAFFTVFLSYLVFLALHVAWAIILYASLSGGLFIAYVAVNRDFSLQKPGENVSERRYRVSKLLLMLFACFAMTVLFDLAYLFWLSEPVDRILEALGGLL